MKKSKLWSLRINSPGGTVTASDILYHELREFKMQEKGSVIASMMDVAASGGYYWPWRLTISWSIPRR